MAVIQLNNGNIVSSGSIAFGVSQSNNIKVDGNSILFLTASKVGIAGNIAPVYSLDVNGDSNITGNYRIGGNILSDNNKNLFVTSITSSGNILTNGSVTATSFTGSFSGSIGTAVNAATASIALSASYLSGSNAIVTSLTASGIYSTGNSYIAGNIIVGGNVTTLGSSSIINITSSAVDIGTNKILINAYSPFQRYAGLSALDSGSVSQLTSSIYWDSLNNYWLFQGDAGVQGALQSSSVMIGGPVSQLGAEVLLTVNTIPKAVTGLNIGNSLLTDNGTTLNYTGTGGLIVPSVSASNANISSNLTVNAAFNANSIASTTTITATSISASSITGSFTGSYAGTMSGTASWASNALTANTASYVNASNITLGTLLNSVLPSQINVTGITASLNGTSSNANTASYVNAGNITNGTLLNSVLPSQINVTGITASLNGTSSIATISNSGSIINTSANANYYFDLSAATSGYQPTFVGSGLTFNPSNNTLTTTNISVTSITGSINGIASNAITASYVTGSNSVIGTLSTSNIILNGFINSGSTGANNNFIGLNAGFGVLTTGDNQFIGANAGKGATTNSGSVFIGTNAGVNNGTASSGSVYIGANAGYQPTQGGLTINGSTCIGFNAGYASTGEFGYIANTFLGAYAGYGAAGGQNTYIGANAGQNVSVGNGGGTFLGYFAGANATNVQGSTFLGNSAGQSATTAQNSIFIGTNAGYFDTVNNASTGSSILIGNNTSTKGFSNSIAIGNYVANTSVAQVNIANSLYISGIYTGSVITGSAQSNSKFGFGTINPQYTLDVNGNIGNSNGQSTFFGTASYALNAVQVSGSSIVGSVVSSSYAVTASYVNASNITLGTLSNSVLPSQINVTGITASLNGTSSWSNFSQTASVANNSSLAYTSNNFQYDIVLAANQGIQPLLLSSATLQFNPNTQQLTATTFNGSLLGNAATATSASSALNSLSSSYIDAGNVTTGTLNNSRLPSQINVTGITASLNGTSSNALNSISSSYATTSSYSLASSNAFLNNGNSFNGTATLGTNDGNILIVKTNNITRLTIDSGSTAGITASAIIAPSIDNTFTLGTSGARFKDVFSVQSTIGALFETGLTSVGISVLPTGTILVWESGSLVPCYEEFDNRVTGVVQNGKDEPIVFGAEPILVTGEVNEGDYIVTSNIAGHGMGISRLTSPLQLFGNVIAQAVENGSGKSYTIKAMIRKL